MPMTRLDYMPIVSTAAFNKTYLKNSYKCPLVPPAAGLRLGFPPLAGLTY
jgi:hypothetical protein